MNHSDIQNRMADYLEGDLSLAKRALFDAHLDGCEDCSSELGEMRQTIGLLRRLPTPEPPPDLVDNVMRQIAEGAAQPALFDRVARWFGELGTLVAAPRFAVPATALAAGLAVVIVTGDSGFSVPAPETAASVARAPQMVRGADGMVAQRLSEQQLQVLADAAAGMQAEALAQNHLRGGNRLGLRGSDLPADETRPPSGVGFAAGDHSLELASAATGGASQAQSVRSRDEWLEVLSQQPQQFAYEHAELSAVEQELWITHLSRRAVELGVLEEVVVALRETTDPVAMALADSFATAAELR